MCGYWVPREFVKKSATQTMDGVVSELQEFCDICLGWDRVKGEATEVVASSRRRPACST